MYVARFVCLFVVVTETIVCKMHGFETWAIFSLCHHLTQIGVLHTNLFVFHFADIVFKTCFAGTNNFI